MSKRSISSITAVIATTGLIVATTATAIPAQAAASKTVVADDFSRSVGSGLGSADSGGAYTTPEPRNMSVSGGQGVLSLTQTMTRQAWVGPNDVVDSDVVSSFGLSALPTAGSVYLGHLLRTDSTGANYTTRIRVMPDKSVLVGLRAINSSGAQTTVGSDGTLPFKMAAGTRIMVRSQAQGSTLRVKAWPQGTSEPDSWSRSATSSAVNGPGRAGLWSYLGGGTNAINVTLDDLRAESMATPNTLPTAAFSRDINDLDVAFDAADSSDSDGSIANYAWDFGDGSTGSGKSPNKKYTAAGTYAVKLTVTDDEGGKGSVTQNVKVVAPNVAPIALFTSAANNLDVAFDASTSSDPDGSIASYAWDFGDGSTGTGNKPTKKYAAAGAYDVKLTVTDSAGAKSSVTNKVSVVAPNVLPTAAFTSTVNDLDVAFDAAGSTDSDGTIATYAWDFGDGSAGTGKTVAKKYTAAGTYTAKLTVTDNRGGSATTTRQVTAIAPNVLPTAAFTESVNDLDIAFDAAPSADTDGTIVDYAWDFGDGSTGSGKTTSKKYAAAGPYSVKLTVTDNRGGKATTTRQVTAIAPNILPAAVFSENVNDLAVSFDAAGSSDSDGTITNYAWGFGDGSTGQGKTANKVYGTAGDYDVTLTVTDNRGGQSSVTRRVTAIAPNVLPTAGFTSNVTDLDVAFDAGNSADSDGSITTYSWEFGDGSTGSGKTVSKKYTTPGAYNVKLTVTDNRNGSATVTNSVTAIAPNVLPTAAFTSGVNDLTATFDGGGSADSDGTIVGYAWGFGDGSTGSGKNASKTYSAAGTYNVTLTVTDNRGGKSSVTKQVTAIAPNVLPSAAFTHNIANLAATFDASTASDPDGTIANYGWEFGDGATATGKTAARSYAAAGTYTVKLTVTDNRGGSATTTRQVTATSPAPSKPSADNTGVPAGMALTRYDGNLTITTPGTVIDGLDIHGYVTVKAANVTIKRSMIRGGPAPTVGRGILTMTHTGASNFLIEDVTIAPTYPNPYVNGINVNQSGTVRRANISGSVDGIMIYGSGVRVESSYLHTFAHFLNDPNWGGGPSHDDAIQVQAGTGIELIGNTLTGAYNTAVMVTQDAGVTKNLSIVGNWIDYGGCSVNFGSKGAFKTGMKVDNNRFGRAQRVSGCAIIHNAAMSDLVPTGNVWDDNGQPATIKRGG